MSVLTLSAELVRTMPDRIKALPRDAYNRPVPWFAHRDAAGKADHRVARGGSAEQAIAHNLCWVCGQRLGRNMAFLVGSAGVIWRTSLEPPMHRSCAIFTARACPNFTKQRLRNGEAASPEDTGVCCVWVTRTFRPVDIDNTMRFHFGEPVEVTWMYRGEPASRRSVVLATDKTLRLLIEIAQDDSEEAVLALLQAVARMRQYLPGTSDGETASGTPKAATGRASAA